MPNSYKAFESSSGLQGNRSKVIKVYSAFWDTKRLQSFWHPKMHYKLWLPWICFLGECILGCQTLTKRLASQNAL